MRPEKPDERVNGKETIQKSPLIIIIAVQKRKRKKEKTWTKEKYTISIRLKQTASTFLSKQTKPPKLWVAAPFLAF
jgi:hypothetical protein